MLDSVLACRRARMKKGVRAFRNHDPQGLSKNMTGSLSQKRHPRIQKSMPNNNTNRRPYRMKHGKSNNSTKKNSLNIVQSYV